MNVYMKPVRLKPNSPEFADEKQRRPHMRVCNMPGCNHAADFRAPKDRTLAEHHWFCEAHVKEYNAAWNYFSGMQEQDVQKYMYESLHGMRPTRPFSDWNKTIEDIEADIRGFRFGQDNEKAKTSQSSRTKARRKDESTPERDALRELGLEETLDFDLIKTKYKQLAKQLHPDINPSNPEAEDRLKRVNMAYTILKMAFAQRT